MNTPEEELIEMLRRQIRSLQQQVAQLQHKAERVPCTCQTAARAEARS